MALILGALGFGLGWAAYVSIFLGSSLPAIPGVMFGIPAIVLGGIGLRTENPSPQVHRVLNWIAIALGVSGCVWFAVSLSFV